MRKELTIPVWEKFALTIEEASQYFGVGEKKIRSLAKENADSDYNFSISNGSKILINRTKFENFLNHSSAI